MERLAVTVTVVGLLLIPGSLSICVLKEGTDSTCSHSSVLVVPHSQIAEGGYSIIVDDLLNLTYICDCSVEERSTKFIAEMGGANLKVDIIEPDSSSFRAKISVPANIGHGLNIILLSYHITACCVETQLTDRLTLKVIDTPVLHHLQDTPAILQCQTKISTDDYWTEFVKDGIVLGYCGPRTSLIQYQNGMSIYYNSSCTLKIDKFTDEHIGHYWCTAMVPYPDGNGFLNVNSTSVYLNNHSGGHADEDAIIGLGVGVGLTVVLVVILSIALAVTFRRNRGFCRPG